LIKLRVLHNRLAKRNVHVMHVARNIETELKLDRYINVVRFFYLHCLVLQIWLYTRLDRSTEPIKEEMQRRDNLQYPEPDTVDDLNNVPVIQVSEYQE